MADQTPALASATEAVSAPIPDINRLSHAEIQQWLAHAAVSAALHDPDGAIVAALRTEFEYRMRTSAAHGRAGRQIASEDIASAAATALTKVRAAILGEVA